LSEEIMAKAVHHLCRILPTALLAFLPAGLFAQTTLVPVIVEAESGTRGSEYALGTDTSVSPAVNYVFPTTDFPPGPPPVTQNPGTVERVATYSVTFPEAGTWQLYARVRVGPAGANDDSMYYGNGFGIKTVTLVGNGSDGQWVTVNQLATGGWNRVTDRVTGGGTAGNQVWKWAKLSGVDWGDQPANFVVPADALMQTFQIGARENGLFIDKFAFGQEGVFFTVGNLDSGSAGTTEPPPPPYVPPGPPLALDQPKFLGGVSSPSQNLNFNAYFNQVTPENGGKWGSVEGTQNSMNWGELDTAYAMAKNNLLKAPGDPRDGTPYPLPFRLHTLIWGNQQPSWIAALPQEQQRAEIEEWFRLVSERYPDIDYIDVVNEPLHDPPDDPADGGYIGALGGAGETGWDWILTAFELARQYFPHSKLGINEFSVTNDGNLVLRYIEIIELLKARGLIDTIGVQGHAFSTRAPNATTIANLNLLAATGLPIYVTEMDIDGPSDEIQLADYQRIFPAFWEHPAVRGITLWGYRPGHWRTAQGAYIVLDNGAERPAMLWLKDYVPNAVLAPWITASPESRTATVGDTVSFSCAGGGSQPLAFQWRKDTVDIAGNTSATTATLTLEDVRTGDAGSYDCVVSNAAGSATSAAATLTVDKALAGVVLGNLAAVYDGTPHAASAITDPPGLAVVITYDGSMAPPVGAGRYAVSATIVEADYFGSALGTLTIAKAAAPIAFGGTEQLYDGTPRPVTVTTTPAGLAVAVTYDGVATPPTFPGRYAVAAAVEDANYEGVAQASLTITTTALVSHAPTLKGRLDGSLHLRLPETTAVGTDAHISGDLLVPGTPAVRLIGRPAYGGTIEGEGEPLPDDYAVRITGGAALRHVVRRIDPVEVLAVKTPPPPPGTRTVIIRRPGQSPGDFATLRNLILQGDVGFVEVPPGTYGTFVVNGNGGLTLGVAGATEPAVYNLQGLLFYGGTLRIVGPVELVLGDASIFNEVAAGGAAGARLDVSAASPRLTFNGDSAVPTFVHAASSLVVLNGRLQGRVIADRLNLNAEGWLIAEE
jgi:endo-1,4-beta-xylanase